MLYIYTCTMEEGLKGNHSTSLAFTLTTEQQLYNLLKFTLTNTARLLVVQLLITCKYMYKESISINKIIDILSLWIMMESPHCTSMKTWKYNHNIIMYIHHKVLTFKLNIPVFISKYDSKVNIKFSCVT